MTVIATIEDVLRKDILDNPGDRTPRLILADWLDDHGRDAEAELIRHPNEIWLSGGGPDDRQFAEGLSGLSEMAMWIASTMTEGYGDDISWTIRNGFVASLAMTTSDAIEHLPALIEKHPIVRVVLTDRKPSRRVFGTRANDEAWNATHGGRCYWLWSHCGTDVSADDPVIDEYEGSLAVPFDAYKWMDRTESPYQDKMYLSADKATAALSRALLAFAREKNGVKNDKIVEWLRKMP